MSVAMDEVLVDYMEQDLSVWDDVEEGDGQVPVVTAVTEPRRTNYNTSHVAGITHYPPSTQSSSNQ